MAILNISKICKEIVQQRAKKATILSRQKIFQTCKLQTQNKTHDAGYCWLHRRLRRLEVKWAEENSIVIYHESHGTNHSSHLGRALPCRGQLEHKYITPQQTFIFFLWQNLHRFLWPSWPNVHKCVKIFLSWKIYCGVGCWQRPWRFLHQLKGWIPASEERADGRWWDGAQESGHETNNHPPDSRLAVVDRVSNEGSWRLREDITNMEQKAPTRVFFAYGHS